MQVEFLAIDTETTGLDSAVDQVIDICLILLDGELTQVDELNLFAMPDPHVTVSPGAAKANGYTPEKWAEHNPITQDELSRKVYDFICKYSGLKLIAHNVPFDQGFLKQIYERYVPPEGVTKKIYSKVMGYHYIDTIPISLFMDYATQGSFRKSYSLANLSKDFNIPHDAAHTAQSDIKACLELLKHHKAVVQKLVPMEKIAIGSNNFSRIISKIDSAKDVWTFGQGRHAGKTVPEVLADDASYVRYVLSFNDLSPEQRLYLEGVCAAYYAGV